LSTSLSIVDVVPNFANTSAINLPPHLYIFACGFVDVCVYICNHITGREQTKNSLIRTGNGRTETPSTGKTSACTWKTCNVLNRYTSSKCLILKLAARNYCIFFLRQRVWRPNR
jgi:hypothetical protein